MRANGTNRSETFRKPLGLLNMTKEQMDKLHSATLEILAETGVKVCEEEAVELLRQAGAQVNGDLVKIEAGLVDKAIKSAAGRILIADRSGAPAMTLVKGNTYFGTGSATPYVIDINSGRRRIAVKEDAVKATIITDALENIDFVMSMAHASDVPRERTDRHHFEAMLLHTTKPIIFDAYDREGFLDILEMAALAAGSMESLSGNPFIIHYAEPSSPLVHTKTALQKLLLAAEFKIPLVYAPAVMCGATGPVTTAGALAVANAEILSGLVIHQLKTEGAPFIYGGGTPPMNMVTSICSYGDPQAFLGLASLVQMSDYYELPSFTVAGATDAQIFDQQAAMEAGFSLLFSALAGGNLVHDLGYAGAGMATSLEYLVLCNEGVGIIRYLLAGLEINPTTLAMDVIRTVGPGGHFLAEEHTMSHFRRQMYFTKIFNRNTYENWLASGGKSFDRNANDLLKEILKWHEVPGLNLETEKAIEDLAAGRSHRRELA